MKPNNFFINALLIFGFSICGHWCMAQDKLEGLDSLFRVSKSQPENILVLQELYRQLNLIYYSEPDTVLYFTKYLETQAKAHQLNNLEVYAIKLGGQCFEVIGKLDSALSQYKKAALLGTELKTPTILMNVYSHLANIYAAKGLHQTSVEYTLKALAIAQENKDTTGLGTLYNNIGMRYSELGEQKLSRSFFKNALKQDLEDHRLEKISNIYTNLGQSYFISQAYDSAIYYYSNGLNAAKVYNNNTNKTACYNGLAYSYLKLNNLILASSYSDSSLLFAKQIQDFYGEHKAHFINGIIAYKNGQISNAISKLVKAFKWFQENNYPNVALEIQPILANIYAQSGQYNKAFDILQQYTFTKDTVFNKQRDLAFEQVSIFKNERQEKETQLLTKELDLQEQSAQHQKTLRNTLIIIGALLLLMLLNLTGRFRSERKSKIALAQKNIIINDEKARSEALLLNILPQDIAEELKANGESKAREFDTVAVLFSDFVKFTEVAEQMTAKDLVSEIDHCFKAFDAIMEQYKVEKIKTIGDAYMAAGGLPKPNHDAVKNTVLAAIEMQTFIAKRSKENLATNQPAFKMRIGIHTGHVIAGIVGIKKFQYDIWGDTVNTASRMESNGGVGKVNISATTYNIIKNDPDFTFEERGKITAKGKGQIEMWFVEKNFS